MRRVVDQTARVLGTPSRSRARVAVLRAIAQDRRDPELAGLADVIETDLSVAEDAIAILAESVLEARRAVDRTAKVAADTVVDAARALGEKHTAQLHEVRERERSLVAELAQGLALEARAPRERRLSLERDEQGALVGIHSIEIGGKA